MVRQRRDVQRVLLIGHQEAVVLVGERQSETSRAAGDRFESGAIGLETEAGITQADRLRQMRPANRPGTLRAVGGVNPVVHAPLRIADARPHFTNAEAGEQGLAHLWLAVAVAIRQIDNVRSAQHDHPLPSRHQAVTRRQIDRPDRHAVHPPVPVGVFQELHGTVGFAFRAFEDVLGRQNPADPHVQFAGLVQFHDVVVALKVVAIDLADEETPPLVERHPRGIGQHGFTGHEFDAKAGCRLEALLALLGRKGLGGVSGRFDLRARHGVGEQCQPPAAS